MPSVLAAVPSTACFTPPPPACLPPLPSPVPTWRQAGNQEDVEKYSKRTVRVTREHNEECKRLLRLMGVPVLDAPTEAEAQCAQLCKDGLVSGPGVGVE